jgi:glycosyltransferase involved in cell wall biosynthesis
MGRPIIAADMPACREIARAEVNALLVPADDADALARLAENAALTRRFGEAGRALVQSRFTAEAIRAATVALYRRVLDELKLHM